MADCGMGFGQAKFGGSKRSKEPTGEKKAMGDDRTQNGTSNPSLEPAQSKDIKEQVNDDD